MATYKNELLDILIESQEISKTGSWHYNLITHEQIWSKEHYKIFEIEEPQQPEVLYQLYRSKIHPDDLQVLDQLLMRAKVFGENFVFDHRVLLDHGRRIKYVQGRGKVKLDEQGKPIHVTGTCQDRTDEVERQTNVESLLGIMTEGFVIHDQTGKIIKFNNAALKLLDCTHAELMNTTGVNNKWKVIKPSGELFPVEERPATLAQIHNKSYSNVIIGLQYENQDIRWLNASAKPFEKSGNRHVMVTFSDVTDILQAEKKLAIEKEKAFHNAKLASIGHLAAGVGHEINNPLAIITGHILIARHLMNETSHINKEEFLTRLEKIELSVGRIANIVKGLRVFARSDHQQMSHFNMFDLVKETVDMVRGIYSKENVSVELHGTRRNSIILGNRGRIQQVIMNLVANAKDATENKDNREINVKVFYDFAGINISVSDNGTGIPEEIKHKIFEPFFTTKAPSKGTGIGLSLVETIVKEHLGSITMESIHNLGSVFKVTLPVNFVPEDIQQATGLRTVQNVQRKKLLIVEDEEELCEMFKFILQKLFDVTISMNATDALEHCEKSTFDLIISDIKMPGMNGFEFLQVLRNKNRHEKFLFITGGVEFTQEEQIIINEQTNGLLFKPFSTEKLYSKLREFFPDVFKI
jgi:PAS domain S-box-containing protein